MSENEKITAGKYFEIAYCLYRVNADGSETLMHEVEEQEPDYGILDVSDGYVEALEDAVRGLAAGDAFDFYADPEKAFGPYDPEMVVGLPKDRFIVDGKFDEKVFVPGAMIPLVTSEGYRIDGMVAHVSDNEVQFDFNHPLAKDRVHYVGKVTLVREPSREEYDAEKGGSCCGGSCGCGNSDGGSCGCRGGGCGNETCGNKGSE